MSDELTDPHGCWRSKTVAFRVSPEEDERIDAQVARSGLTKHEKVSDEEWRRGPVPDVVHAVIAFVRGGQAPSWSGTASDLLAAVGGDVCANILSKYLNEHSGYMEM